ncbi:MAG: hypothetical protein ACI9KE_004322 [Polyangiales bacterium]|jgi:hypothetical protein
MPTWSEVQDYARSKYKLAEDNENSFKLVFEYENDRLQAVIISRYEAMGREWCDFASAACTVEQMPPATALRKNFEFAVGALTLDQDIYVVRYSVQMATMDMEEFELPLHVVSTTADKIEQEFGKSDDF